MLVAFLTVSTVASNGEDQKSACSYVVNEVSFENTQDLSRSQVETLRSLVVGRCYDPVNAIFFSQYVYEQLRNWGFCKATVYDPNDFRILDPNVHPMPIAVAVDFRLTDSDVTAH
jgi:hypothetical protein